ncbi:class I SAM-dependent methyltransferase [Candidatus Nitrospira neomarina]|uniref:Class I SAM-dependent methyltransferase n=1 Tax=Candidatus Nitrospira neomarina TaxID=3020899 RepID=A0AA96JYN3_9BACT|nr:class I SAM-dependent methyltransferase [Candidatus Nitrospira neomarina]WNM60301.1 class I SAM-dependent methyltransferase [Candidatus Nitrospira neomarina]
MKNSQSCRFCGMVLEHTFLDLGTSPFSNSYVKNESLGEMEPFFPLYAFVCSRCLLVQLKDCSSPERIFSDYAYFSSYSDLWLQHACAYTDMIQERIKLDERSLVVEVASNDGYLLQYFVEKGIPVLGIEPAENVAKVATEKGISTRVSFFGERLAQLLVEEGKQADLLIGNNVLAHVPDLNDFVCGLQTLLKPQGVITMEFPHVMRLMEDNQFDTIYHEHFSYFSFGTVEQVFRKHGLILFDVEEIPTHGGSLRIYARHEADHSKPVESRVAALQDREKKAGLQTLDHYLSFSEKVHHTKRQLLSFLIEAKEKGKTIVGYGAPAKGNTLLNYCGIRTDFIDYTVDRSPHKQGLYLPGTHIPIYAPDAIRETKPDYVLILPWNLKDEIMQQMACIREWGGAFVVPIPEVRVYP